MANYHYTYLIMQENTGEFYIGVRTSKIEPDKDPYMGSPCTWKKMDTYDLSKQKKKVLRVYDTREEANEHESALITAFKNDPLNRNYHDRENFCPYGLTHSEETKRKISEIHKGRTFSDEHKRKMSKTRKGRTLSKEWKQKIGEAHKGRTRSEETKQKMRNNTIYNWIHVDGTEISCTRYELYATYNLCRSHVYKVIKGKLKKHKGWSLKK